jgi:molybdate transport system ATP-binding protein
MTLAATLHKRLSASFKLDVQVSLEPGITILFGASGSGKTTVLHCLSGLHRPDSGRIAVGDRVLFDSDTAVDIPVRHRRMGYVFQHLALFPHLTVAANIQYGLTEIDAPTVMSRTREIAESFRIAHVLHRTPGAISGGERQRVALARSLVTDPCLLLLDEPLSALDYVTQTQIIGDLRAWTAARRIPVIYVTHAQREVFALGERVLVMQHGRIVAEGTPQEVMQTPAQEPIAQLAGFENILDATVVALKPEAGTIECRLAGTSTELEAPFSTATLGEMVRLAIRAGDILLAAEEPRSLSARNVIPGRITSLRREGTTVIAKAHAGHDFEVHLTPGSSTALNLTEGAAIWLVIKTHSCRLVRN